MSYERFLFYFTDIHCRDLMHVRNLDIITISIVSTKSKKITIIAQNLLTFGPAVI